MSQRSDRIQIGERLSRFADDLIERRLRLRELVQSARLNVLSELVYSTGRSVDELRKVQLTRQ